MAKLFGKQWMMELLHYIVVFAVIAVSWVPMMGLMGGNTWYTLASVFGVFVIVDQLAHIYLLKEQASMW